MSEDQVYIRKLNRYTICTPISSAVTDDKYGEYPKPGSTDDPDDHPIAPWPEPGPWRKENAELHAKVAELEAEVERRGSLLRFGNSFLEEALTVVPKSPEMLPWHDCVADWLVETVEFTREAAEK